MFYRDASAVIVCYDVSDRGSFDEMRGWLDELRLNSSVGEVVVAIAALKADLLDNDGDNNNTNNKNMETNGYVPENEVEQLADTLGVIYLPTSAKNDYNVNTLFQRVADQVLENRKEARIQKLNDSHHTTDDDDETMMETTTTTNYDQHNNHESSEVRQSPPSNTSNGRSSPRRSKYDRNYKINTDVNNNSVISTTPSRGPKSTSSRRRTKITVDTTSSRKKGSSGTSTSTRKKKKDSLLLQDEHDGSSGKNDGSFGCCQPVGCGAGDGMEGNSGCIVS